MTSLLAKQGTAVKKPWSLARDNQRITALEAAFAGLHGYGVLSGGAVTKTGGFGAKLAAGTRLFAEGVIYTVATDRTFTAAGSPVFPATERQVWVWGQLTRVPANQLTPLAADTYTLTIATSFTSTKPTPESIPLALLTNTSGGIRDVEDPEDKLIRLREDEVEIELEVWVPVDGDRTLRVDFGDTRGYFTGDYHCSVFLGEDIDPQEALVSRLACVRASEFGRVVYLLVQLAADAVGEPEGSPYYGQKLLPLTLHFQGWGFTRGPGGDPEVSIGDFAFGGGGDSGLAVLPIADGDLVESYLLQNGSRALTGNQSFGGHKATNLADPTSAQDAATKAYVDGAPTTLTDAATIATDASLGTVFDVSIAVNRTLGAPSNPRSGQRCIWRIKNTAGSGKDLSLTTGAGGFRFGSGITGLTTIGAGKMDILGAIYHAGDNRWDVVAYQKGF